MKKLKHLCFDKDGVLIDVHAYWRHTSELRANFIIDKFGLKVKYQSELIDAMGINNRSGKIKKNGPVGYEPRDSVIDKVSNQLHSYSITPNMTELSDLFKDVDEHQQKNNDYDIKLLDGVFEFLNEVKNKYVMTIFTSDREKNAKLTLLKLGIDKYFSEILGGDSVVLSKPNPEGIIKACQKVSIDENETAYISDTLSDLLMAENANVSCKIGVLTGLGTRAELKNNCDIICEDFSELIKFF
tara:strand:+ start:7432 stop:8157 length:726 start_codon:yes stop_codon:yes gene_type:complete